VDENGISHRELVDVERSRDGTGLLFLVFGFWSCRPSGDSDVANSEATDPCSCSRKAMSSLRGGGGGATKKGKRADRERPGPAWEWIE
jgi:hypothetical protein